MSGKAAEAGGTHVAMGDTGKASAYFRFWAISRQKPLLGEIG